MCYYTTGNNSLLLLLLLYSVMGLGVFPVHSLYCGVREFG